MKIISVIEEEEIIKRILKHFGLWEVKARPSPKSRPENGKTETLIDDISHLPVLARRPAGVSDRLYADFQYPEVYTD